jgi:predicted ATP-dependent endonuclease of OLD family
VLEGGYKDNLYSKVKSLEEILREHVKTQTGLEIFLRFSLLDPMEILSNLRPYFKEGEIEYDSEDMGAGIQSALAVAIAIAYAKIVRKPLIIAIEEPELYLHPHGCRHFYRLLKNLTEEGLNEEGLQVIYTTHERSFINISNYREIHIVRKENEETRVYSGINLQDKSEFDGIKSSSKFNEYINEVFFAEHVILVEGFSDKIACQIALEKLGLDLDLKNISIIECGGKKEIKPISEILKHFGIKTYVLIDADAEREISELEKLIGEGNVFKQEPDLEGMLDREKLKSLIISLGMEPEKDRKERLKLTKEQSLKVLPKYFEQNDIPETYSKLKDRIEGG